MERWGVTECVCAVELFIQTGSITETQCAFRCEWNQQEVPSPNAIHRWVRQWCEDGSVTCKKPPGQLSSVCTPDNIAGVLASVSHSLRRPARKHAQVLCMSDRSLWHILHSDLSLHPYKLQEVNALSNRNREMRLQFNLLKPTGYVMHQQFNIQQLYALHTVYLYVLYLSENKQQLVPLTS